MAIEDRRYPLNTPEEDRAAGAREVCWRCSKPSDEMEEYYPPHRRMTWECLPMCPRCVCAMEDQDDD